MLAFVQEAEGKHPRSGISLTTSSVESSTPLLLQVSTETLVNPTILLPRVSHQTRCFADL
jgi:hypothetical protein